MNLRYGMQTAFMECEITNHPQKVMQDLGITYHHSTPQSVGDQWWFWNCENLPSVLPEYLTELNIDPMECIGFGLNEKTAIEIRDYKKDDKTLSLTINGVEYPASSFVSGEVKVLGKYIKREAEK